MRINLLTRFLNRMSYYRPDQLQGGGNCGLCGKWIYEGIALKGEKWAMCYCDDCLGIKQYIVTVHSQKNLDSLRHIGEITYISSLLRHVIGMKIQDDNVAMLDKDPNVIKWRESAKGDFYKECDKESSKTKF